MITAIDTNILIDILIKDPDFGEKSRELLERQGKLGSLVISQIAYSEVIVYFLKKHEAKAAISKLDEFLEDMDVQVSEFTKEDLVTSAESWQKFGNSGNVTCPKCGAKNIFICRKCKSKVFWRNHILTDFLIGAHAQNHADVFLTRDRGYYKKYFKVNIMP